MGQEAKRGLVWTTLQSLINRFSGFVVFLVLARLLEPRAFGIFAAAVAFVTLTTLVAEAGLSRALIQRPVLTGAHLDTSLALTTILGLVLSGVLLLLSAPIGAWFDMQELAPVLALLAPVPFLSAVGSVPEGLLRRRLSFRSLALRSSVGAAAGGLLGIGLGLAGFGVWALVGQLLTQYSLSLAMLWWAVRWRPGLRWERRAAVEVLSLGGSFLGIGLLNALARRAPDLIIGALLGPALLGIYAVAQRAPMLLTDLVLNNANSVAIPIFSRGASQPERLRRMYVRALEATAAAAFALFLTGSLVSRDLVPLVFGDQWSRAGELMAVLLLLGPAQSMLVFTNSTLLGLGRGRLALGWTATSVGVRVSVAVLAIPHGLMCFAIASATATWLLLVPSLALVRRVTVITVRDQLRAVTPSLGSGAALLLVGWTASMLLDDSLPLLRVGVLGTLAILSYATVLRVLNPQVFRALSRRARRRGL